MEIKINIEKRHFFVLLFVVLMLGGVLVVYAFNPGGTGGIPSTMGHSVDEIDWSKPIVTNGNPLKVDSGNANNAPILAISAQGGNDFISIFGGMDRNQDPFIGWRRGVLRFGTITGFSGESFIEKARITPTGLEVTGRIKIAGGSPGNNKVLTSDAMGLASWQNPAGDITTVNTNPGSGLSGGATSGTVNLVADTNYLQKRVTGLCSDGQAIRIINSDGSVTCANVPPPQCIYNGRTYTGGIKCNAGTGCPSGDICTCTLAGTWACGGESASPCPAFC